MKRYKKYILTLIFMLGILLFSNTNIVKAEDVEKEMVIPYNEEINVKNLENIKTTRFKALLQPRTTIQATPIQEDISKYYYNQLKHDVSRNTYNTLTNQLSNSVTIDLNNYEYNVEQSTEEALIECFQSNLLQYVIDGYEAYIMDGTKNYWWTPETIKFGDLLATVSNNKATFKNVKIQSTMEEWNNYDNFNTKLETVCNSLKGESVYEIVRSINYYICSNVEYTELDDTSVEQSAYGALIINKAVCEGQAHLFNLMCREKGISCINVYGYTNENNISTAHAWNYVYEPSKGKWYAVDVTWNNSYNDLLYFMVGSDTEINGIQFGKNHIAGFKQFIKQTYTPSTPILSAEKYIDTITLDEEYITNIQPDTEYSEFIKEFSSGIEFTVKEKGNVVTDTDIIKTGQILTINGNNFTLIVLGDTNGDGRANINDIMAINKHRLNIRQLTDIYLKAGDVNKDGTVNIKDIMQLNKYRLEKINEF